MIRLIRLLNLKMRRSLDLMDAVDILGMLQSEALGEPGFPVVCRAWYHLRSQMGRPTAASRYAMAPPSTREQSGARLEKVFGGSE